MNDHIKADELQHLLRQFDALGNVTVAYKSDLLVTPVMTISGFVQINGHMKAFETDVSAADFKSADDVLNLVGSLLESFERASQQVA